MSSMASQNPGLGHLVWIRRTIVAAIVHHQFPVVKRCDSKISCSMMVYRAKSIVPGPCQRKSWPVLVRLRVGTHQEHRSTSPRALCTCRRFMFFSHVILHKQMSLSTQPLWKNFPQGHCAWRPSSLSILSWSSSMSSLTSVMASLTSMAEARAWQLNESMQQL